MREAGLMHGIQMHSCAVLSSGAVSCWGDNDDGRVIALECARGDALCADQVFSADW